MILFELGAKSSPTGRQTIGRESSNIREYLNLNLDLDCLAIQPLSRFCEQAMIRDDN